MQESGRPCGVAFLQLSVLQLVAADARLSVPRIACRHHIKGARETNCSNRVTSNKGELGGKGPSPGGQRQVRSTAT